MPFNFSVCHRQVGLFTMDYTYLQFKYFIYVYTSLIVSSSHSVLLLVLFIAPLSIFSTFAAPSSNLNQNLQFNRDIRLIQCVRTQKYQFLLYARIHNCIISDIMGPLNHFPFRHSFILVLSVVPQETNPSLRR